MAGRTHVAREAANQRDRTTFGTPGPHTLDYDAEDHGKAAHMLRRKRTRWLVSAGVLGAAALLAIGMALWPRPDAAPPAAIPDAPGGVAPRAQAPAPAPGPTPQEEEAHDEAVEPVHADLPLVCAGLDDDQLSLPTQECMDALDARFLPLPASRTILPVSPPLVWRDVFEDIAAKIEAVDVALADAVCDVPEGEIRPALGERCAARATAALDVLRRVCSLKWKRDVARDVSVSPKGVHFNALNRMAWNRVNRTSFGTNVDATTREHALDRWSEQAPDQETWAAGKRQINDLYYRTAWKWVRCWMSRPTRDWMRGERWDGLLARAARLGDSFALAHHLGGVEHAEKLVELDAPQGHLHLASLALRNVRDAWWKEEEEAVQSIFEEQLEDRIRLLKMAGIDCGDCTAHSVNMAFSHATFDNHFRQCAEVKCANLEAMRELKAALDGRHLGRGLTRPRRSLPHRKRAEAVAMKYALAVETLAEAAGVDVDLGLLRHLADADAPALLTAEEVEQARSEAAQLVAAL